MARINYRIQIIDALKDHGAMTSREVADYLGLDARKVGAAIYSARFQKPGQVFRIVRYQPVTGRRQQDTIVFAAEAGEDVACQPYDQAKRKRRRLLAAARYRAKHRLVINAKKQLRNAVLAGRPVAVNPWLQLAAPGTRATMARLTSMGAS